MKNLVVVFFVTLSLCLLNSCEKQNEIIDNTISSAQYDFENFSLEVVNNTLVFESEKDVQGCIDYLVAIGEDKYDEFEKSIGYRSFRSTGKDLPTANDPLMKTLINPEMENIICGYLVKSDFAKETATAYKLNDNDLCNLANLNRAEMEATNLTFDNDFFEFAKTGVILKDTPRYCTQWTDTHNDDFKINNMNDMRIIVFTTAEYNTSLFYKYLKIYYSVSAGPSVSGIMLSYATTDDCFFNKNSNPSDDETFERSEDTGPYFIRNIDTSKPTVYTFERKPYTGTSRLERYKMNVNYTLTINGSPNNQVFSKYYNTDNYCIK